MQFLSEGFITFTFYTVTHSNRIKYYELHGTPQGPAQILQSYILYLWILCHKHILPGKVRTRSSLRSITNVTDLLIGESLKNPGIQTRKYVGTFNQRCLSSTVFSRFLLAKKQKLWKEQCQNYCRPKLPKYFSESVSFFRFSYLFTASARLFFLHFPSLNHGKYCLNSQNFVYDIDVIYASAF